MKASQKHPGSGNLVLTLKLGDVVYVGDTKVVFHESRDARQIRLLFKGPPDIKIQREKVAKKAKLDHETDYCAIETLQPGIL
jgi:sRNA-binding carbon storage regulator CsrA